MADFALFYEMEDINGDVLQIYGIEGRESEPCLVKYPNWETGGTRIKWFKNEDAAYDFGWKMGFRE